MFSCVDALLSHWCLEGHLERGTHVLSWNLSEEIKEISETNEVSIAGVPSDI
jgi:hypothetical protein